MLPARQPQGCPACGEELRADAATPHQCPKAAPAASPSVRLATPLPAKAEPPPSEGALGKLGSWFSGKSKQQAAPAAAPPAERLCAQCRKPLRPGAAACHHCGRDV
jgi:predicted amidophosphoribosyltransferase